ncbi:hydroxysqualene dehydroxylase HpnE [Streptomyces sp. ST2-7A]|uniref:hydroxysqualene dehydroxylase HpnE n=1 Tax=Streptomyces sp. ST2-7A TaxID=2907214 RepID=UPI0035ABCF57
MDPGRVLVVGGGLAGVTAALALADRGHPVTLVESRPRLGGLAFSFTRDREPGPLTVDNGQHVYLRCCTAYRGFLRRVGAEHLAPVQPRLDVPVLDARTGRLGRLRRSGMPAPLHLAGALARYPHLSPADRASVVRAALALRRLDPEDPALDRHSFGSWLRRYGTGPTAVAALWDLVGVATLNARADDVSLALAVMVFRTGLLSEKGAADIGLPQVPLGEIHHHRAGRALERAGVRVLTRTRVRGLRRRSDGGWWADLRAVDGPADPGAPAGSGNGIGADTVVLALPQDATRALLPPGALSDPDRLGELGTAPILDVHVIYDRPVSREPFLAVLNSPVQWVFDRTVASGLAALPDAGASQYLALSQSAAGEEIDLPVAVLRERYLSALARAFPGAREARVRDFFVTREREATFDPAPNTRRLRPGPVTAAPGLFLAGAWTATGWPATMEGAVRSGLAAAKAVGAPGAGLRIAVRGAAPVPGDTGSAGTGGDTGAGESAGGGANPHGDTPPAASTTTPPTEARDAGDPRGTPTPTGGRPDRGADPPRGPRPAPTVPGPAPTARPETDVRPSASIEEPQ